MSWIAALLAALLLWPAAVGAAEVLQVRGATLLQLGDQNRSYSVELACIAVVEANRAEATAWLRQELPRRTRVNLRPMGQRQGVLLAAVQVIGADSDLGTGLVARGLAQRDADGAPDCARVGS